MLDSDVDFIILLGRGVMYDLDRILEASGVLSVEELESVLFLSPGVLVFLGTPEPKPMGVGLSPRDPERMLEVLLTPLPRLPSSSELSETLEPW